MIINLNGLEFSEYGTGFILGTPVQGIIAPPIRTPSGNFSGRDGGWVDSQFYASREIVLNVSIDGNSCDDAAGMACQLQESTPIRQALPLTITTSSGDSYYADVFHINTEFDVNDERFHTFQITLLAPDPYFYGVASGSLDPTGWIEHTIYKIIGGGYPTPYILPVVWAPGTTPTNVNNPSSIIYYPQIVLQGRFTNPRITNNRTGEYVQLDATTSNGDTVVIDHYNRTVTLNGGSILPQRTPGSTWWGLLPGNNSISLTSDSGDDEMEAIIRYRIAYTGVYGGTC